MNSWIKQIDFFSDKAVFETINDSNSGAILKKVTDGNDSYFLKIVSENSVNIERIKLIINIYEKSNVDTIRLLKYGYIGDKIYLVYNFINGYALNTVYDKFGFMDFYDMGYKIGYSYNNINSIYKAKDDNFAKDYNINDLVNNQIFDFLKLYNGDLDYIKEIISEDKMNKIINRMKALIPSFSDEEKVYIHSDIHPKNIMIDSDNKLYIIDIESFCIDYFVMNLRWSIASAFRNRSNYEFFKGFIKGYYCDDIPQIFNKQLILILILNFIDHVIEFSQSRDKDFIKNYVSQFNFIFNNVNLYEDENILFDTIIFKD